MDGAIACKEVGGYVPVTCPLPHACMAGSCFRLQHLSRSRASASVNRIDANDRQSISRLLAEDSPMSALICGDTETVLSHLPDCIFQTCVTSPPYWSLRDYDIQEQIGLEDSVF